MTNRSMNPQTAKRRRWGILSMQDQDWLLFQKKILQKYGDNKAREERKRESTKERIQYSGVAGTDHRVVSEKDLLLLGNDDNTKFVPSVK